ncbi:MAG: 5'-nucleotidase, lipoprotein e(P4) family [Ginsengibacter sp.]
MKKLPVIIISMFASCTIAPRISVSNEIPVKSSVGIDGKIFATAYMQRAAEYRALCFQAYNIAHLRVNEIANKDYPRPKALITDIDETVLDNSPYEAHQTLQGKDYELASWAEWTAMANADTVPGALSFLKYASSKGIEVFYVTNRGEKERDVTLKNLQKFNFPNADNAHIMLRENNSSKEERRKSIAASYSVTMLLGDNLADFDFLFDVRNTGDRMKNVNTSASEFGDRFIILPNFTYGDWESSLYNYTPSLTQSQKDSLIKAALITY